MKAIELETDKYKSFSEALKYLKSANISEGDTVILRTIENGDRLEPLEQMIAREFNVKVVIEQKAGDDFIDDENVPLLEPEVRYGQTRLRSNVKSSSL